MTYKTKYKFVALVSFNTLCLLAFNACQSASNGTKTVQTNVTDAAGNSVVVKDSSRIVFVGTANTETVYALGAGARLVGVDNSSGEYLKESAALPKVGARTTLSAEGILSLKPTLVILNTDAGPLEDVSLDVRAAMAKRGIYCLMNQPRIWIWRTSIARSHSRAASQARASAYFSFFMI